MEQQTIIRPQRICFNQLTGYSLTNSIEEKVMLVDDLNKLRFNQSIELDFIALLFCTQGHIELEIQDKHYYVGANDVLYCNRGTLLHQLLFTQDYEAKLLCVSWEYAQKLLMRGTCRWESILHTRQYPLIHLQSREQQLIKAYHQLLAVKVDSYYYNSADDVDCIFFSFFRDFHQILLRYAGQWDRLERNEISCRRDELFKRFIVLLKEHIREEHFVAFYADQLCVTPKYLSMVVKSVSGQGVSKWIDASLVDEIKSMLHYSNLSISEIADELHFSNPSFFGKYVKSRMGESPVNVRKRLRNQSAVS